MPRKSTNDEVVLEQTLHGYRSGHELLASSSSLSGPVKSTLLMMSDLSGSYVAPGFGCYLTGYPVEREGWYALARTWYAPEMPRPGCVWTHTLLIKYADLAQLEHLRPLLRNFRRPSTNEDLDTYAESIEESSPASPDVLCCEKKRLAVSIAEDLYSRPLECTVVVADESARCEDAVMAVWSKQWPRLRRSFRFCTGVMSNEDDGFSFDLKVIPRQKRIEMNDISAYVDTDNLKASDQIFEYAIGCEHGSTSLQKFLWQYGPDHEDGRSAWMPLVKTFQCLSDTSLDQASRVLSILTSNFPEPEDARRLKKELFGPDSVEGSKQFSEVDAVVALAKAGPSRALLLEDVALDRRLEILSKETPRDVECILVNTCDLDRTPVLDMIESSIAKHMTDSALEATPSDVRNRLVQAYPPIAARAPFWKTLGPDRAYGLEALACLDMQEDIAVSIIETLSRMDPPLRANEIMGFFGAQGLRWYLLALSRMESRVRIDHSWVRVLKAEGALVKDLLGKLHDATAPVMWLIGSSWKNEPSDLGEVGDDVLRSMLKGPMPTMDQSDQVRAEAFFLAAALRRHDELAGDAIEMVFEGVYQSAADRSLDAAWDLIEPVLQSSPWIWWDRCERMARTVASWFVESECRKEVMVSTFRPLDAWKKAVNFLRWKSDGAAYLRELWTDHEKGKIEISRTKAKILKSNLPRYRY